MSTASIPSRRQGFHLFFISMFILFLELACIRWFASHVLFLTFFTNTILLASFLGMSVGCLAASRQTHYIRSTHCVLALAVGAALAVESLHRHTEAFEVNAHQASPQVVYFGTEHNYSDVAHFVIPIEALCAFFFLVIALLFVGPGQELGRAFQRIPNRIGAYTLNVSGGLLSIALFAACSWWQLSPFWWFLPILIALGYFSHKGPFSFGLWPRWAFFAVILVAVSFWTGTHGKDEAKTEFLWSPYYRVEYTPDQHLIVVNQIGHQQMITRDTGEIQGLAYEFPHLLNRDAGRPKFKDVLIIGAGSGNDVSRSLQWGAETIDAVEIDPVIQRLGKKHHPDRPYDDSRVTVHLDDGRNFLRSADKKYDLIIYALVDSLILHSSYSNLRLESYLFTNQAFADVRSHLKPDGLFVMYNFFRQGWIVSRLGQEIEETFGSRPLVLTLPYRESVSPEEESQGFVMFLAGNIDPISARFAEYGSYGLRLDRAPGPDTGNGFIEQGGADDHRAWLRLGPAEILPSAQALRSASDDWPFLYVRQPALPMLTLRGMGIMGVISCLLIWHFSPARTGSKQGWNSPATMFLLGAGFMLIETNAVVHMALLFGSTWMVNSVVFFAVLLMILAANLYVQKTQVRNLLPYFLGLALALILNWLVPLDVFLGMNRSLQIAGACLLSFAPIFFAGIIFARLFSQSIEPDRAFGANIAGAIAGGLAENLSMLLGFHYLVLLASAFYALAACLQYRGRQEVSKEQPQPLQASGVSA